MSADMLELVAFQSTKNNKAHHEKCCALLVAKQEIKLALVLFPSRE